MSKPTKEIEVAFIPGSRGSVKLNVIFGLDNPLPQG
jgi:hypothetical protein